MATDATDNIIYDKDRADKLKFDNVYGELDFFKKKCEILEKDLFKSHTSNKKNEAIIKKLQDMIAIYGKVKNYSLCSQYAIRFYSQMQKFFYLFFYSGKYSLIKFRILIIPLTPTCYHRSLNQTGKHL